MRDSLAMDTLPEAAAFGPVPRRPAWLSAPPVSAAPAFSQRLLDKIAFACHGACESNDLAVAEQLVQIMERMVLRAPLQADGTRRGAMETLVAAHERLWLLRHPQSLDAAVAAPPAINPGD